MKKTVFYHFLETKDMEEKAMTDQHPPLHPRWEVVEIRDEPPRLLQFFPWEINKVLTENDVANLGSLELRPEHVHNHIFKYWDQETVLRVISGEQLPIVVQDMDTGSHHNLLLRKWPNDKSFSIHGSWAREFVLRRGLKEGMLIGMYWDIKSSALRFSLLDDTHSSGNMQS